MDQLDRAQMASARSSEGPGGRQMHLNFFMQPKSAHFPSGWRHPLSDPEHAADLETIVSMVQLAESACFDSVFLADTQHLLPTFVYEEIRDQPDPLVLLGALAARTQRIGLIGTINTTVFQPYDVARKFATLDRISGGRSGINLVTGSADAEARNYGNDVLADPAARYARAAEFVEVLKRLWLSWDDDALVFDRSTGVYAAPERVHAINHAGKHFRSAGPLNVPPMPQRFPVLVQAGQSPPGRDFAARYAETVFTAQNDLDGAVEFATDIRARATRYGRLPSDLKILPGMIPILGGTEAEATQLHRELGETVGPAMGLEQIRYWLGIDLTSYTLDERVPVDPVVLEAIAVDQSDRSTRGATILEWARREHVTVRQLMFAMGARAHGVIVGTGEQIADVMEHWFKAGACDGFNVAPALMPKTLQQFASDVIPVLRERGLFRNEYAGATLRDHLELERPQSTAASYSAG